MKVLIRCAQGVVVMVMMLLLSPFLFAWTPVPVPEPSSMILLGTALAGLAGYSLYKRSVLFPFVQQTTGIQNLIVPYSLALKVAVPSPQEQSMIARYLDPFWSSVDEVRRIKFGRSKLSYDDDSRSQLRALLGYRDGVVFECVTGIRHVSQSDIDKVEFGD